MLVLDCFKGLVIHMAKWKACIGLEIHAQLQCASKLFSPSQASSAKSLPNTLIHEFDVAIPGTLPQLNKMAVQQAIKAALAMNCNINKLSFFDRKHYFYQDLPLGYQITQQRTPIAGAGKLMFSYPTKYDYSGQENAIEKHKSESYAKHLKSLVKGEVVVDRIQIEQDSGKSLHDGHPTLSLIDFNRAGMGLIEIVFAPELETPEQAIGVLTTVQELLRHLSICDGNLENGSMRCDVNVSVSPVDRNTTESLKSKRVEIKNLNSTHRMFLAATYEINRQIQLLENNEHVHQETRGFDETSGKTYRLRSKEQVNDYRYFPDPDLPPLLVSDETISTILSELPELPVAILHRYLSIGLDVERAQFLLNRPAAKVYFDKVYYPLMQSLGQDQTTNNPLSLRVYHWVATELNGHLNAWNLTFETLSLPPSQLAELLYLLHSDKINAYQSRIVFVELFNKYKDSSTQITATDIATELGFLSSITQTHGNISPEEEVREICTKVITDPSNVKNVDKYRNGSKKMMNFFLGEVMKLSKGKLDHKDVRDILIQILDNKS